MLINIPAHEYHADPALGSTSLKRALITPSHYWGYAAENPNREVMEEKDAFRFGRLAHALVLEGEEVFKRDFIVLPAGLDRRTTVGKETYANIMAMAGHRTVVKSDWVDKARAMRAAVQNHYVWQYLQEGVSEGSHFWEDEGLKCKVRLDWVKSVEFGDIVIDYKTTVCAAKEAFSRQIFNLGYNVQAHHYFKGFESAFGRKAKAFLFVAQEKVFPYAVGAYMLDPNAVATGAAYRNKAIDIIKTGRETGIWHGYTEKIEMIDIPTYAQYSAAEVLEQYSESDEEGV
jgi:hypothetical protein